MLLGIISIVLFFIGAGGIVYCEDNRKPSQLGIYEFIAFLGIIGFFLFFMSNIDLVMDLFRITK